MKIIFGIDGRGQSSEISRMLQLAIKTCKINTSHTVVVIADQFQDKLRSWLTEMDVLTIEVQTPMKDAIIAANNRSGYPLQAIGNYIRYEACNVIKDDVFLYCDCDTIFLRDFLIPEKPRLVAAVAEDRLDDWSRFNSGVILINRAELAAELPAFYSFASSRLEEFYPGFDQAAFNAFFKGRIEQLSPNLNWRPYWGENPRTAILHTHGVKPSVALNMLNGIYTADISKREQIEHLVSMTLENLPHFADCLLPFADDTVAKMWLELSYSAEAAIRAPLRALFARLQAVREDVLSTWASGELATISKALNIRDIKTFSFGFDANNTDLRLVVSSQSLFTVISDLINTSNGSRLSLSNCLLGNVADRREVNMHGTTFHILKKLQFSNPIDIVFNIDRGDKGREFEVSFVPHALTGIRRFWSNNGIFTERQVESLSLG